MSLHPFSTKVIFAGLPRKALAGKQAKVDAGHQCFSVVAQSTQLQPTVPQKQLNKGVRAVQSTDSDFSQQGTLVSQFFFTDAKVVSYRSTISACGKSIQWQFAVVRTTEAVVP